MIKAPTTYVAWDLETSGLKPEESEILEIGCVRVENGEIAERKSWLLNHGIEISDTTVELTGITKEMIDEEGVDPQEAFAEFMEILTPGVPHLTHNGIRFDIPFLAHHLCRKFGKTRGDHRELTDWLNRYAIDTAVIIKGEKLGMEWQWGETFKEYADRVMNIIAKGVKYNVGICCEELDVDTEGLVQHRALADVELTHRIYQAIQHPILKSDGPITLRPQDFIPGGTITIPS